jgi:ribulose-5-phosphate 4-epimerase/fuculose-1-phosphate aldolase
MATVSRAAVDAASLSQARIEMTVLLRAAARHGFNESIDNHFSLALPGRDDLFLLNRYGPHWSEITPADILLIDLEGTVADGDGDWEITAFMIHRAVHRARPSARCVLHTHMPFATAVAMTDAGLDTRASQNAMYFHGRTVRIPFGGLADGAGEGDRLAGAVGADAVVAFLDNHGVIVIGQSPADAWHKLYMLERACQTDVHAKSTRRALIRVPEAVAAHTGAQWEREAADGAADAVFAAERRLLERDSPGFLG